MLRHHAICGGSNQAKDWSEIFKRVVEGNSTFEDEFEDMYGYSLYESVDSDEDEEEGEYEAILFRPANM